MDVKKSRWKIEHWHAVNVFLVGYDIFSVIVAYLAALWLRFDGQMSQIPASYIDGYVRSACFYAAFCVLPRTSLQRQAGWRL